MRGIRRRLFTLSLLGLVLLLPTLVKRRPPNRRAPESSPSREPASTKIKPQNGDPARAGIGTGAEWSVNRSGLLEPVQRGSYALPGHEIIVHRSTKSEPQDHASEGGGDSSAEISSSPTDRTATPQVLLLHLRYSPRSVVLLESAAKSILFRPPKAGGEGRLRMVDRAGGTLYEMTFVPPVLCDAAACSEAGADHERGDVRLPHEAEIYLKVPDLAEAGEIRFFRVDETGEIPLGRISLH